MARFDEYIEKVSRYIEEMRGSGSQLAEFDRPGPPETLDPTESGNGHGDGMVYRYSQRKRGCHFGSIDGDLIHIDRARHLHGEQ